MLQLNATYRIQTFRTPCSEKCCFLCFAAAQQSNSSVSLLVGWLVNVAFGLFPGKGWFLGIPTRGSATQQQPLRVMSSIKKSQWALGSYQLLYPFQPSLMNTLWSVLATGFDVARQGAGYTRRHRSYAGSEAGWASSWLLPDKVRSITSIWVGEEGHNYLEDF